MLKKQTINNQQRVSDEKIAKLIVLIDNNSVVQNFQTLYYTTLTYSNHSINAYVAKLVIS